MIDIIIWILEMSIEWLGEMFIETCTETWEAMSLGFNEGQYSIYDQNIRIAIEDWLYWVAEEWIYHLNPLGVDMADYDDTFWSAYDPDVLERAFSDSFWEPYDDMQKILNQAQNLQEMLEFGEFFG